MSYILYLSKLRALHKSEISTVQLDTLCDKGQNTAPLSRAALLA